MMKYYLGLFTIVVLSFLALFQYDIVIFGADTDSDFLPDIVKILLPGIFFSLFLLVCILKHLTALRFFTILTLLEIGYFGTVYLGFLSWGLAVPVCGAIGAIMISGTLAYALKSKVGHWKFIGFGISATLPGWVSYITLLDKLSDGIVFGIIICGWQVVLGALVIRQIHKNKDTEETDLNGEFEQHLSEESDREN